MQWLTNLPLGDNRMLQVAVLAAIAIFAIAALIVAYRALFGHRLRFSGGGRARQPHALVRPLGVGSRAAIIEPAGFLLARYKFEYRRPWARRADTPLNFSSQAARAKASRPCSTVTIGSTTRVRSTGARS